MEVKKMFSNSWHRQCTKLCITCMLWRWNFKKNVNICLGWYLSDILKCTKKPCTEWKLFRQCVSMKYVGTTIHALFEHVIQFINCRDDPYTNNDWTRVRVRCVRFPVWILFVNIFKCNANFQPPIWTKDWYVQVFCCFLHGFEFAMFTNNTDLKLVRGNLNELFVEPQWATKPSKEIITLHNTKNEDVQPNTWDVALVQNSLKTGKTQHKEQTNTMP